MTDRLKNAKPFSIWEGIYDSLRAAAQHQTGLGFRGDTYKERTKAAAQSCLRALRAGEPIPQFHKQRSSLLPITVAMMLGGRERIRVLDFGGGLGIGYMTLVESIGRDIDRVDYAIVEVPEICDLGRKMLDVQYLSELDTVEECDLLHAASSIQYVENWQDLVKTFSSLQAQYILLSDVFAGAINTFATLQNYYESKIPHWFLNLDELLNECLGHGYRLAMKSYATSRRLDSEDILPMDNFPENYRLKQSLHLLLEKNA
jgi:putative methyltransferase (TIGR04325 family)